MALASSPSPASLQSVPMTKAKVQSIDFKHWYLTVTCPLWFFGASLIQGCGSGSAIVLKLDPDPHLSENSRALEVQNEAVDTHNLGVEVL